MDEQKNLLKEGFVPLNWLRMVFKVWAVIGFLAIAGGIILLVSSLLSFIGTVKGLGDFWGLGSIETLTAYYYVFYAAGFVLLLAYLLLFWGAFKLCKWVIPILFILAFFSIINIFAILFRQPLQFSAGTVFLILWNAALIILASLAHFYRHSFSGTLRKLPLQIIFFIFAIPVLTFGSLTLLYPDLPEVDDLDLIQVDIFVPPQEENVYFALEDIRWQVHESPKDTKYWQMLEGKEWDQAEADSILKENEGALEEIRKAATYSYYQCPTTTEDISYLSALCSLTHLRQAAGIISLSALSKAHQEDFQGAIEDGLAPIRIGQLLIDAPAPTIIDYLVGEIMKERGLETLQIILKTHEVPSEILLPAISEMATYTQNEAGLKNILRNEYVAGKNTLSFFLKYDSNFYFQPKRFFNEMAERSRQQMALTDIQCHQLRPALEEYQKRAREELFETMDRVERWWRLAFIRNAVFEIVKSIIIMDFSGLQERRCEADLLVEQTRLQMALEAYKQDRGLYPDFQSELVPNYISELIVNPITDTQFEFNQKTGEIVIPTEVIQNSSF